MGQRGPGGIENTNGSSDLTLWLDANRNIFNDANGNNPSNNNNSVSLWRDASGRNIKSEASGGNRPKYKTNSLNGYPTLYFDGSNDFMSFAKILNPRSIFIVYKDQSTNSWISPFTNYKNVHGFGHGYSNDSRLFHSSYTPSGVMNGDNYVNGTDIGNGNNHDRPDNFEIHSRIFQSNMENYTNYSHIWGGSTYSHHRYFVGADRYFYRGIKGNIAEIITFDRVINLAERIIIENYLSAKYNLPLNSNNYYKMDNSSKGNYDHHVAGIGRASNGSTHLQSRGTGIVEMKNPSNIFTSGNQAQFLFWGSNKRSLDDLAFEQNGDYAHMLNAKWRVDKQKNVGNVTVSFDLSEMDYEAFECTQFKLLVSNSSNFTSNVDVYDLTLENGVYTVDNVDFSDQDYFTIEYAYEINWDGASYYNGSNSDYSPSMADGCMKMTVDNQVTSGGTYATLSEDATVKEVEIKSGNTLVIEDGVVLYVEDEIHLDGEIRLIGDAQIVQKHSGVSKVTGTGSLYRQRASEHPTKFTVQYLSSPVSVPGTDSHDVFDVLHTGGNFDMSLYGGYEGITAISVHPEYAYAEDPYDAGTSPLQLSNFWMWKFVNGSSYTDWQFVRDAGVKVNAGEGFSIKGTGRDETYVFIGKPNDGTYTASISAGNESLLGNPYPSALDSHKFITDNLGSIDGTLYFWDQVSATDHTIDAYEGGFATLNLLTSVKATHVTTGAVLSGAKTPQRYLPVGQGFFVKGSSSGGTITFDNSQRIYKTESSDETTLLRTVNSEEIEFGLLKLSLGHYTEAGNLGERQIAVGFKSGLTDSYENGFDSKIIDMQSTDFYWQLEEEEYVIAGVEAFDVSRELPLVVQVESDGVVQFKLDELSGISAKVFLKDIELQTQYELTESALELILEEGVYGNRFKIVFEATETLDLEDVEVLDSTIYYTASSNELVIRTEKEIKEVMLYNLLGQRILQVNIDNKESEYRIPIGKKVTTGVYIVNILTENGNESLKIKM